MLQYYNRAKMKPKLCAPVTDIFFEAYDRILPFLGAVEYKNCKYDFSNEKGLDILFESPYGLLSDRLSEWLIQEKVFDFLARVKPLSFSCDLGPSCIRYIDKPAKNGALRSFPDSPIFSPDEIISLALKKVNWIRRFYSGTLKFEILNFYPTGVYDHVCDPAFINEFLEAVGGELLLDLGHARISAFNLGLSMEEYIFKLPMSRVSEIHLSRPKEINGELEDTHEKIEDEDIAFVKDLLTRHSIKYLVVEYYKDKEVLGKIFKDLHEEFSGFES